MNWTGVYGSTCYPRVLEETHDASGAAKENRGCAAGEAGGSEAGLIRKKVPMTIALLGPPSALVTGTAYRLLSSDGLRVQVVPFAQSILSRLTSPWRPRQSSARTSPSRPTSNLVVSPFSFLA